LPLGAALLTMFGTAASTGMLVPNAQASFAKRREDEDSEGPPLLMMPSDEDIGDGLIGHRSHRSHSSHSSHYSGSSGRAYGYYGGDSVDDSGPSRAAATPPPPPPRPALVSLVALPGGKIFVDGKLVGIDATPPISLTPGSHVMRVENRFLGNGIDGVTLQEGQSGVVTIEW